MDSNEYERIDGAQQVANGSVAHRDKAHLTQFSLSERQGGLHEEVERLRLEVEHLRDHQQALNPTPQSNDLRLSEEVDDHEGDDSSTRHPPDRRGVLRRR